MDKSDLDLSVLDAACGGYLEFLQDDALAGFEAGLAGDRTPRDGCQGRGLKRERGAGESEGEEGAEASGSGSGKAPRMERRCGRTKACREKARRERINERFQELAKLCDPEDPKTDKVSILAEAIKIITQLKVEAGQLRQLNKFLEERVGNQEKEKGKNLYQQSLMLQNQYQSGTPTVQQPAVQFPLNSLPQGRCQVTIGVPAAGMTGTSSSGAINPLTAFGSTSQPASQVGSSAAVGPPASGSNIPNASSSMPSCQTYAPGPVSWMPFMDTSQDHLLRPPAA